MPILINDEYGILYKYGLESYLIDVFEHFQYEYKMEPNTSITVEQYGGPTKYKLTVKTSGMKLLLSDCGYDPNPKPEACPDDVVEESIIKDDWNVRSYKNNIVAVLLLMKTLYFYETDKRPYIPKYEGEFTPELDWLLVADKDGSHLPAYKLADSAKAYQSAFNTVNIKTNWVHDIISRLEEQYSPVVKDAFFSVADIDAIEDDYELRNGTIIAIASKIIDDVLDDSDLDLITDFELSMPSYCELKIDLDVDDTELKTVIFGVNIHNYLLSNTYQDIPKAIASLLLNVFYWYNIAIAKNNTIIEEDLDEFKASIMKQIPVNI